MTVTHALIPTRIDQMQHILYQVTFEGHEKLQLMEDEAKIKWRMRDFNHVIPAPRVVHCLSKDFQEIMEKAAFFLLPNKLTSASFA